MCNRNPQPQQNHIHKLSAAHAAPEKNQAFFSHQPNSDAIRKPVRSKPLLTRKKPARRAPRCRVPDPPSAISSPRRAIRSPLAAPRNNKKTRYQHNFNTRIKYIPITSPVDKKCNSDQQPQQNHIDRLSTPTPKPKKEKCHFSAQIRPGKAKHLHPAPCTLQPVTCNLRVRAAASRSNPHPVY